MSPRNYIALETPLYANIIISFGDQLFLAGEMIGFLSTVREVGSAGANRLWLTTHSTISSLICFRAKDIVFVSFFYSIRHNNFRFFFVFHVHSLSTMIKLNK